MHWNIAASAALGASTDLGVIWWRDTTYAGWSDGNSLQRITPTGYHSHLGPVQVTEGAAVLRL